MQMILLREEFWQNILKLFVNQPEEIVYRLKQNVEDSVGAIILTLGCNRPPLSSTTATITTTAKPVKVTVE